MVHRLIRVMLYQWVRNNPERQIINLAPGDVSADSTDAINGSQLYSAIQQIEKMRYFSVNSTIGVKD